MWLCRRKKNFIKKALENKNLELALQRASSHHWRQYEQLAQSFPIEDLKAKARQIREENLNRLPELIKEFVNRATEAGAKVYWANSGNEALNHLEKIIRTRQAKLIIKAKSMVSEEIGLNDFLEKKGLRVVETDLGEWIVQLAKERPSHITAPALHKTKEEIAALLSQHLGRPIPPVPKEITRAAREYLRPLFFQADLGLTGANLAIAESGTLVIISNEGNARLVATLPPVHVAIVTVEKIVATMEQASTLIKALVASASGKRITSYVSFITGPSSTTDIEKEPVIGVHGPEEVHIILLDNGRLALVNNDKYQEILTCLKCGGCMLVCPVFQSLGGHIYGGPVYPGGIGLLFTFMTRSIEEIEALLSLCADCKKCEIFCPVGIHTGELIAQLKNELGPKWGERLLSFFMQKREFQDKVIQFFRPFQKLWSKDNYLKPLPLIWIKGKRLPLLQTTKRSSISPQIKDKNKPLIYLFEGCLNHLFFPSVAEKTGSWLEAAGFEPLMPLDQACCGAPSFHLGDLAGLKELVYKNLTSWKKYDPAVILTFCPTGYHVLTQIYPQIEPEAFLWKPKIHDVVSFLEWAGVPFVPEAYLLGRRILYHSPCHLEARGIKKEKRQAWLEKFGLKVTVESDLTACCGFCGVFSFRHPEVAAKIWSKKKEKIVVLAPEFIITECPGCLFQLKSGLAEEKKIRGIYHLAEIIDSVALERKRVASPLFSELEVGERG
ncbi:MAG: LUD domain-containing protein [Candidatus Aminicenantes bacterium]|nr:LUD domain-containing protein [Candidatus Aminicenantes bacterium]